MMKRESESILAAADDDWSALDSFGEHSAEPDIMDTSTQILSLQDLQGLEADVEHAREVGLTLATALIERLPESPHAVLELEGTEPVRLTKSVIVLGRGRDIADVCVEDDQVSRHHAAIIFTSGEFYVEDLQSTNGSFINGRRIRRAKLHPGDILRIGDHRMQLRWID